MSGQLLVVEPGLPVSPHVRIWFTFTDGGPDLRFTDQRTFGHMAFVRDGAELPGPIAHIAPDPFEPAFDAAPWPPGCAAAAPGSSARCSTSRWSADRQHLRRRTLWRAGLHWARPTETLNGPEVSRLLAAVREVLGEALAAGGTSFDSLYVNVNGESGYFERSLAVYGREGLPCLQVRHADPAGEVHEPVGLQLPPLPAPPAALAGARLVEQSSSRSRNPFVPVLPKPLVTADKVYNSLLIGAQLDRPTPGWDTRFR